MPSRVVVREHRNAASVLAAGLEHQSKLTEKLTERLTLDGALEALGAGEPAPAMPPLLPAAPAAPGEGEGELTPVSAATLEPEAVVVTPPETPLDLHAAQQYAMWMISFYTAKLLEVDDRLRQEIQQLWVARSVRDDAAQVAYDNLVAVRQYVTGVLDERAVQSMLDVEGATPTTPFELRDTLQRVLRRLQAPSTFIPEPRVDGLGPDWERVVGQLQEAYEPLHRAVQKMEQQEKAARSNRRELQEIRRIHRDALIGWRSMLQGMAIAAGDRELASDFRLPRIPSSGNSNADDEGPGDSGDGSGPAGSFPEDGLSGTGFAIPAVVEDDEPVAGGEGHSEEEVVS